MAHVLWIYHDLAVKKVIFHGSVSLPKGILHMPRKPLQPSPDKFIQMGKDSAVAHLPIHKGAQTH